jgi:NitT/TauT family transport system substrate-binding protein
MTKTLDGTVADASAEPLPPATALRRRNLLRGAATAGVIGQLGLLTAGARAAGELAAPAIVTARKKVTLIWGPSALCLVPIAVAKTQGIFEKHGLDVETLNVGYDTTTQVEAIALGKADATSTFLMRLFKPLEAGFDVKLTAGLHGGCSNLVASHTAGIKTLQDLRGKNIGMTDLTSPMKVLYEWHLMKNGVPPDSYTWRQYPADLFSLAVDKGEIDAFADGDPNAYFAIKRSKGKLFMLTSNGTGELGKYTCCVVAIGGKLLRDDRPAAAALTAALIEAARFTDKHLDLAADASLAYSPKQVKREEVSEMLAGYPYDEHRGSPTGEEFRQHMLYFARALKETNVLKPSTDPIRLTNRIVDDVLTS